MANPNPAKDGRLYAGQTVESRRLQRREKLIEAGYILFGTLGFHQTKIDAVCAEAGVGIRSLYDEFGRLEELFRAVYVRLVEQAYDAVDTVLSTNSANLLEAAVSAYLHCMLDDPKSGRIVSIESGRLDIELGPLRSDTLQRFSRLSETYLEGSNIPANAKQTWSIMFAGAINEIVVNELISETRTDPDALARVAANVWQASIDGYRADV
ncbi:MAG: TetR/AcrR family transcriptional regulator [Pseudomonadota bacterium]